MSQPTAFLYLALLAYFPFVAGSFWLLGGRRGFLFSLLAGWMFLPWFNEFGKQIPLLHNKEMFIAAVVLGTSILFDFQAWRRFRPRWFDLPAAVICVSPFFTSLSTGLGAYDGGSAFFEVAMKWTAPYLLGRVYLGSPAAILQAGRAIVIAGMVYAPLCLWEIRMSPQLHRQIYGFHQHLFSQHIRDGSYRPMLFMAHGLMVAMFMATSALVAFWLWRSRAARRFAGVGAPWVVAALVLTTALCRSAGPFLLLIAGMAILESTTRLRTAVLVLVLAFVPAAYCTLRISGWDAMSLVIEAERWLGPDRAESLRIRIVNDRDLTARAMERPWLGWGRGDAFRLRDEEGRDVSIVDSMWILRLGTSGLVGLIASGIFLALPLLQLLRVFPAARWGHPRVAPAAVLATAVGIWAVDDLSNAMTSPIFPAAAGAVLSFCVFAAVARGRRQAAAGVRSV
ncbi:MAG: hypothetical protein WB493_01020, partial [Anaeromyxobacteraceae bacterium]